MWLTPRPLTGAPENFLWGCQGIGPPIFRPCPLPQSFPSCILFLTLLFLRVASLSTLPCQGASLSSRSSLGSLALVALHSCPPVFPSSVPTCGIGPQASSLSTHKYVCTQTPIHGCLLAQSHVHTQAGTHTYTHRLVVRVFTAALSLEREKEKRQ